MLYFITSNNVLFTQCNNYYCRSQAGALFGSCFNPAQGVQDYSATNYCNNIFSNPTDADFGPTSTGVGTSSVAEDCNNIVMNCHRLSLSAYVSLADV